MIISWQHNSTLPSNECLNVLLSVSSDIHELHVIVVSWLLKCVGFVLPKVLPRAQPQEVHDKPEGGA